MASDVDDVVSRGARYPGLRRNPHETCAWWRFDFLQRVHQRLGTGGLVRKAMDPDYLVICSRIEHLFLGRTGDCHECDGANARCQAFDPTADGRQRGFVTDEKPPIEIVRNMSEPRGPLISTTSPA